MSQLESESVAYKFKLGMQSFNDLRKESSQPPKSPEQRYFLFLSPELQLSQAQKPNEAEDSSSGLIEQRTTEDFFTDLGIAENLTAGEVMTRVPSQYHRAVKRYLENNSLSKLVLANGRLILAPDTIEHRASIDLYR